MNRFRTFLLAAITAIFTVANALPASAQSRGPRMAAVSNNRNTQGSLALGTIPSVDSAGNLSQENAVRMADQFAGADAGAKIAAAIADLPAAGGTVDARGLEGAQSAAATIAIARTITLLVGNTTLTLAGNPGINVTADGVEILGLGEKATFLHYSGTGTAVKFKKAAAVTIVEPAIRNLTTDGTGNANAGKKALEIVDAEEMAVTDFAVSNWTDAGTHTSIGVEIAGRQTLDASRWTINADNPVHIVADPNIATISLDGGHFKDIYTIAHSSQPNFKIADGTVLLGITWDGYQRWVNGTYGIFWNSTTDAVSSNGLTIRDCRWEQSTNATGYAVYLRNAQGIYNLNISGCLTGAGAAHKGYYLRNIANGLFSGNAYSGTIEAFNIGDGTVSGSNVRLDMVGNWFNVGAGATISTTGFAGGIWAGNDGTANIGFNAVSSPTTLLHLPATGVVSWDNGSGTPDTNLYRDQANVLRTDDTFMIKAGTTNLQLTDKTAAGTVVMQSSVLGDANDRLEIQAGGLINWGPGNAALDTFIQRSGVNQITISGLISSYNGISTVESGLPASHWNATSLANGADIGGTNLIASAAAGRYRLSCYVAVTQQATTSSILPDCNLICTDPTDSVAKTIQVVPAIAGVAVNPTTGVGVSGSGICDAKAATAVQYSTTGYTTVGATPMQYKLYVILEAM